MKPERRAARRAALARGAQMTDKRQFTISKSQVNHAANPKARKKAGEGERWLANTSPSTV